jgi:DNA polymerase I
MAMPWPIVSFLRFPSKHSTTKAGEPTNATYGFTRTLMDILLGDDRPKYLAVSFDQGVTHRDELFDGYKATREKMPDALDIQIARIREVVQAFNVPILEVEGYEADDVLGTVARQAAGEGVPVLIVTGDQDILQLVDDNTQVQLPDNRAGSEQKVYDRQAVIEKLGVRPDQIVDYKALVGDSSDNIPGVRGIGAKTAVKLLDAYGTLEGVYEHLDEQTKGLRAKLEEGRADAFLSQTLARIVLDAPLTLDLEACVAEEYDPEAVLALFQELEFRSLTNRLAESLEEVPQIGEQPPTETITVRTPEQLQELVKRLETAELLSFDVETTGLDKMASELVGICLSISPAEGYYIPVGHLAQEGTRPRRADGPLPDRTAAGPRSAAALDEVLEALKPALTDPNLPKLAHNAKYDMMILRRYGIDVAPVVFDTMIAEWLTDPASKFMSLKGLASHRLGVQMTEITELIGSGKNQKTMAQLPVEEVAPYGAADADMTLRLMQPLESEIAEKGLERVLEIEMPFIDVLVNMEREGVAIDVAFFREMSRELDERLQALEKEIYAIAGRPFNINSTQQLSDVLFQELKLPTAACARRGAAISRRPPTCWTA